jgi:hypothetical protein
MKNFFKYKSGVNHYHSGSKAQTGMIDYTFLLPCKNEKRISWSRIDPPQTRKHTFLWGFSPNPNFFTIKIKLLYGLKRSKFIEQKN